MSPPEVTSPKKDAPPVGVEQTPPQAAAVGEVKGEAKTERGALAADQTEVAAAAKREELRGDIYDFNDEEKGRYKNAFGKDLEPRALVSLTIDELAAAEAKEPGMTKMLFKKIQKDKKETFTAHNNSGIEWQKGLKDLVDENVSEITLYIHPKNLSKGGNQELLKNNQKAEEALAAYQETPPRIILFERKSTKREDGDFYNDDGYLRIFDGDTWSVGKMLTAEEFEKAKSAQPAKSAESGVMPLSSPKDKDEKPQVAAQEPVQGKTEEPRAAPSENKSVVAEILPSRKLDVRQIAIANLIMLRFTEAGLSKELASAAIINAWYESKLHPWATGDGGASIGIFQLRRPGVGSGMSVAERKDPEKNIARMIENVKGPRGTRLRAKDAEGGSIAELTKVFCFTMEVPKNRAVVSVNRAAEARTFFQNAETRRMA